MIVSAVVNVVKHVLRSLFFRRNTTSDHLLGQMDSSTFNELERNSRLVVYASCGEEDSEEGQLQSEPSALIQHHLNIIHEAEP